MTRIKRVVDRKNVGIMRPPYEGLVAQSVEQRTENPCVGGSIPPQATIDLGETK